jgi:hypothetical protein
VIDALVNRTVATNDQNQSCTTHPIGLSMLPLVQGYERAQQVDATTTIAIEYPSATRATRARWPFGVWQH